MKFEVVKVDADRWAELASSAHLAVFGEVMPPGYDRIDFALLIVNEANKPVGYATVRQLDQDSVYLKHGGSFPPIKDTVYSLRCYRLLMAWLLSRYKRITTLVESKNTVYLKMALTVGFRPIGCRQFKGSLLVELFAGDESAP